MSDMICEPEMADYLLDRVTENAVAKAEHFARAGADGLYLGDDIGMQTRIMMSEELYCRFLKPRLKKVILAAKKIKPDIIIVYHSCGYILPFIPHLIESGVEVLNPIQPESMDFKEIFLKYGDRLSFLGTIGTQTQMPFAKPEEIANHVKDILDFVGPKGGLLIAPTHILEPDVPAENIAAYRQACLRYKPVQEKRKKVYSANE